MTDLDFQDEEIEKLIKDYYPEFRIESDNIDINKKDKTISIKKRTTENGFSNVIDILYIFLTETLFKKTISGDTFYHFVPLKYVNSIFEGKIRLYNLGKYIKEDPAE